MADEEQHRRDQRERDGPDLMPRDEEHAERPAQREIEQMDARPRAHEGGHDQGLDEQCDDDEVERQVETPETVEQGRSGADPDEQQVGGEDRQVVAETREGVVRLVGDGRRRSHDGDPLGHHDLPPPPGREVLPARKPRQGCPGRRHVRCGSGKVERRRYCAPEDGRGPVLDLAL